MNGQSILSKCIAVAIALLVAVAMLPVCAFASKVDSSSKVVRIGLFEDTYHKFNEDGQLYGYGYEYLQKIASYTGWTLEYVEADWYTCFDKLESGEIDILNGISYTEDRAKDMLFSAQTMAEERYFIYGDTRDLTIDPQNIGSIDGKTIGVMEGAIPESVLNSWEKDNGLSAKHTNITTAEDVLNNLDAKKMDCFVSIEETWEQDYVVPLMYIGSSDVYFALNKGCADLKKELDNAMSRIFNDDPFYNDTLFEKYFATPTAAVLTEDERKWAEEHGVIRIGCIIGDVNIAEQDAKTGEFSGIVNDYIDYARDCLGDATLEFEVRGYANMEEELTALQNGEIDMIFKVPYNAHYVAEYNLSLTNEVLEIPYSAVSQPGNFDQNGQVTVAIPKDNWVKKWYVNYCYPNWEIVDCSSVQDAERKMRSGEVNCFLVRTGTSRQYIKDNDTQVNMLDNDISTCFGVARGDTMLLSILNKTVKAMPAGMLSDALTTYDNQSDSITAQEFIKDNLEQVLVAIMLVLLAFALILGAWCRAKKSEVQLEDQLLIFDTLSRNFKNVYLVDLGEGTAKILKFDDEHRDELLEQVHNESFPYEGFLKLWIERDVYPDDQAALLETLSVEHLRSVFAKQNELSGTYRMLINGQEIHYQYDLSTTGRVGHVVAGFQCIEPLIQERLEAERVQREKDEAYQRELLEAKLDAEKANATKTDFLRRMSHDIRTPINGIRGMVQIANGNLSDGQKIQDCGNKIWKSTDHLLSLVNDVLDMNKLESGRFTLHRDPFTISGIMEEVFTVIEPQVQEYGVHFDMWDARSIEHDRLLGSPVYIKRIFMNFISNAIKYNRAGGSVEITGHELSFDGTTAWFEFVCKDTGIGMSEEFLLHAFEPFTQEEQSQARTKYNGSGLGLTISKSLIEHLGGTLVLESVLNEGTKVTFRLPLEVDLRAHVEERGMDYSGVKFDGVRALLVEDNDLNAEIATFLLEQHGLQIDWVENGQLALDTLAIKPDVYDVVFMDVMMPVMDGLEATRRIRGELKSAVPIFAMTANAFIDDVQLSLDAGMNEHLTKPLREKDIIRALLKHVVRPSE